MSDMADDPDHRGPLIVVVEAHTRDEAFAERVLAGPRDGPMPASQQARLEAAADGGFVLGGIAAVPTDKLAGRDMTRLGGATRWETAQLVGRRASGDATAGTSTATEPREEGNEDDDTEGKPEEPEGGQGTGTEEEVPEPVLPSAAWIAYNNSLGNFLETCGFWEGTGSSYASCDNPADNETAQQMESDVYNYDFVLRASRCRGLTIDEQSEMKHRIACPDDFYLDYNADYPNLAHYKICYHRDYVW